MKFVWERTEIYSRFDAIYVDGKLLQLLLNILGLKVRNRLSFDFSSIADDVFNFCVENNYSLVVVGSDEISNEKFQCVIREKYPRLHFGGWRNGFFSVDEEVDVFLESFAEKSKVLIVCGMGTPKQDYFLVRAKEILGEDIIGFSCGGFIHQTAHAGENYYPKWVNAFNLRAFYRMFREPHTIKRYVVNYPINILSLILGSFLNRVGNNNSFPRL